MADTAVEATSELDVTTSVVEKGGGGGGGGGSGDGGGGGDAMLLAALGACCSDWRCRSLGSQRLARLRLPLRPCPRHGSRARLASLWAIVRCQQGELHHGKPQNKMPA